MYAGTWDVDVGDIDVGDGLDGQKKIDKKYRNKKLLVAKGHRY